MTIIAENRVLSNSEEHEQESNFTLVEEDLYQQMRLIKLEDIDSIPLEEVKRLTTMDNNKTGKVLD